MRHLLAAIWLEAYHQKCLTWSGLDDRRNARWASLCTASVLEPWVTPDFDPWTGEGVSAQMLESNGRASGRQGAVLDSFEL